MRLYYRRFLFLPLLAFLGLLLITLQSNASNNIEQVDKNAVNGNIEAQKQLGEMYFEGEGVLQDYAKAHAWFRIMALFGDNSSRDRINQLQQEMTDDEIYEAIKEYNIIYKRISEFNSGNLKLSEIGQITDCDIAKDRMLSLERKDQNNFEQTNNISDFCQLAEGSLTIWTEIDSIVTQCPDLDTSGAESQFAKESIYWATETKLRTCSN